MKGLKRGSVVVFLPVKRGGSHPCPVLLALSFWLFVDYNLCVCRCSPYLKTNKRALLYVFIETKPQKMLSALRRRGFTISARALTSQQRRFIYEDMSHYDGMIKHYPSENYDPRLHPSPDTYIDGIFRWPARPDYNEPVCLSHVRVYFNIHWDSSSWQPCELIFEAFLQHCFVFGCDSWMSSAILYGMTQWVIFPHWISRNRLHISVTLRCLNICFTFWVVILRSSSWIKHVGLLARKRLLR